MFDSFKNDDEDDDENEKSKNGRNDRSTELQHININNETKNLISKLSR